MERKKLFIILISVIIILLGILVYFFFAKPAIQNMQNQAAQQGAQYAVYMIMQQASTCQQVPLTFGNQTINLIAVECLQK